MGIGNCKDSSFEYYYTRTLNILDKTKKFKQTKTKTKEMEKVKQKKLVCSMPCLVCKY